MRTLLDHLSQAPAPRWPALLIWSAIWLILLAADPWLDLANLSLILLTGSVAASLWLAPLSSIIVSTASVIAFNWLFVPPRGSFHVELPQHLMLLLTTMRVVPASLHHANIARVGLPYGLAADDDNSCAYAFPKQCHQ